MASILGAMVASMSGQNQMGLTSQKPKSPTAKNKPSKRAVYRRSEPSKYFGQRSNVVTAYTNKGEFKQMKLKNALKKGFPVSELGEVTAQKDGSVIYSEEFINSKNQL